MSLELKQGDIITRWASGHTMAHAEDRQLTARLLRKMDKRGLWRYLSRVDPEYLSVHTRHGYYVSVRSYDHHENLKLVKQESTAS
jgi:hypothetical protein